MSEEPATALRCVVCRHPAHQAINEQLLQRVPLRTIAGKHRLALSTLYEPSKGGA